MHPLESLITEHIVISRLVDALVGYARCLGEGDGSGAEPCDLHAFARFFREFADELHHEKEENVLMPALALEGFSWSDGVLADVRLDHQQERYLIDVLCQASERASEWNPEDRRRIASTAMALAEFQQSHLRRENEELFPEVARRLSCDASNQIHGELSRFDERPHHRARSSELVTLSERLVERYVSPRAGGSRSVSADIVPLGTTAVAHAGP
jgi:hemerythrin-like domain-containing protein